MLEEALQVVEGFQRLDEFLEVFEPPRRLGRLVGLPHPGVAGFVEDRLGQPDVIMVGHLRRLVPAIDRLHEDAQRAAALAADPARGDAIPRAFQKAHPVLACLALYGLHRLVAKAPFRRVDHPLERQIVLGRDGEAEISHRVANLHPLIESEAVLEGAHLVAGADEDGLIVQAARLHTPRAALDRLGLLPDPACLLLAVPMADEADLLAARRLGPERLAEPLGIDRYQARGGGEDVFGGAVVLFQPDHLSAGKVLLEAQDP